MSYFYSGILGVVTAQVIGDLGVVRVCVDSRRNAFSAFCQNFQYSVIHIIVYKNDSPCGFPD